MKLKKIKRFILLATCIGCFSSTLIVSAGSNSRYVYNSQNTICAYSKGTYTKGLLKDKIKIYATIYSGVDAREVTSANLAYYTYKPNKESTSKKYNFYFGKTQDNTHEMGTSNTDVLVTIKVDDTSKTYYVYE